MTASCEFYVRGIPQTQGSTKAFVVKGRPIITSTNKNLKDWRTLVALEAQNHAPAALFSGGVNVKATFFLPKPKRMAKKYWRHTKRPDLDKLIRAICDSLTGIVYKDDSQVFGIDATKLYASDQFPVGVSLKIIDVGAD